MATDPTSRQLWIVIPAFNEGRVIEGVVAQLRGTYPNVVVVDDCSSDDTGERANMAETFKPGPGGAATLVA